MLVCNLKAILEKLPDVMDVRVSQDQVSVTLRFTSDDVHQGRIPDLRQLDPELYVMTDRGSYDPQTRRAKGFGK